MSNFKHDNLEIILEKGQKNKIFWRGISDNRDPYSIIDGYFTKVLDELKNKELEIDFVELQYMNSSTVTPIIKLIRDLNNNAVKTTVFYDKNLNWQLASFRALETIAKTLNHITIKGK